MYFDTLGNGPRTVLLLHGCPTTPSHMEPLARALAAEHTVLNAHLPGYGNSPVPPAPISWDEASELLEAALIARGVEEVAAVGFSGGAYRAFLLAARKRVRVSAVVSLGGFMELDPAERQGFRDLAGLVRSGIDLRPLLPARLLGPVTKPEWIEEVGSWGVATTAANLADELDGAVSFADLTEACRAMSIPVVARVGEHDLAAPVVHSQRIADAVQGAVLEVVPGVGHSLLLEDFEGTLASIRRALAR